MALSWESRGTKLWFVVKLQVQPIERDGDIMLYDSGQTFQVYIGRATDPDAYAELCEMAKNYVRWNRVKVFAHVKHVEGENNKEKLEILTSVLPDQELFW